MPIITMILSLDGRKLILEIQGIFAFSTPQLDPIPGHTDMQENAWARLRDSRPGECLIHATSHIFLHF